MVCGCVLPENLGLVDDTETNYGPSIIASDPTANGTRTIIMTRRDFELTIEDANVRDTLYLRYFVDYYTPQGTGGPTPPIAITDLAPNVAQAKPDPRRQPASVTIACVSMLGVPGIPSDGNPHVLTALVADRPFLADDQMGPPSFRQLPSDARETELSWGVACR
jgi:hypothetical protein